MIKIVTPVLLAILLSLTSCNGSPIVVFHSYDELTDYPFFDADWVPEIVRDDITDIRETYAVDNGHVFGRFDFINRNVYDSIFVQYQEANPDSLLLKINSIKRPKYPKWYIPKQELVSGKYQMAKQKGFYLLLARKENRIYFLK